MIGRAAKIKKRQIKIRLLSRRSWRFLEKKRGFQGAAGGARYEKAPVDNALNNPFITKDGYEYTEIAVDTSYEHWRQVLCHEIAHVLLCRRFQVGKRKKDSSYWFKEELRAWELAKSFCKPECWDKTRIEAEIVGVLEDMAQEQKIDVDWGRIYPGIKPINKGISLR